MILTVVNKINSTYKGWFDIQSAVNDDKHGSLFPVGTEIIFQLNDGKVVNVIVRAVDHYQPGELVFGFKRLYFGNCKMNNEMTNKGGWINSDLRSFLNEDIISLFPKDLVSVLAKKESYFKLNEGILTSCFDKLWLPTECEVTGYAFCSNETNRIDDDNQFESYKDVFERIMMDQSGEKFGWWTSSQSAINNKDFIGCGFGNLSFCEMADEELGVVPHFVIRKELKDENLW